MSAATKKKPAKKKPVETSIKPYIAKITVNIGVGEAGENSQNLSEC